MFFSLFYNVNLIVDWDIIAMVDWHGAYDFEVLSDVMHCCTTG
jgi:hypothetical protein